MKPFGPTDHMGPQSIVKEEVWEDIIPPPMVCSRLILPLSTNPVEGILGNLENSPQRFFKQKQRGELPRASSGNVPTRRWGMNPVVKMLDLPKKPTHGQLNGRSSHVLSKDSRLDDRMLR